MLRFLRASSLTVLLAAFESDCSKRHVAAPIPPTPAVAPADTVPPPPAPPIAAPSAPAQTAKPQTPPPSAPPASASPRNSSGQPNPAPRLGDILTPEQERQYNSAIDQSLARTQSSLGVIANRKLTKEQQGVVVQIQSFVQQAQTTRKSNLAAARSLAERADVLARDLVGSLR
jgi:hypothetical protein